MTSSPSPLTDSLTSLETTIRTHPHRPLLHHINADSSWLLQLPHASQSTRKWYNILIDPWLAGSQTDYYSWFSEQWHGTPSSCGDIRAVEELARRFEKMTAHPGDGDDTAVYHRGLNSPIDLAVISHEFTDHCHFETLTQLLPSVPVVATTKAASLIRSWGHFTTVATIPAFRAPRQRSEASALPAWLDITRLTSSPFDAGALHSALCIAFDLGDNTPQDTAAWESVIYTPHGIPATSLQPLQSASPPIRTLALLHGLSAVSVGLGKINLGASNGVEVQRVLQARHWVRTHDEDKGKKGLVAAMMWKRMGTVAEYAGDGDAMGFTECRNGEGIVLV